MWIPGLKGLIRTFSMGPSVSLSTGFDCTRKKDADACARRGPCSFELFKFHEL